MADGVVVLLWFGTVLLGAYALWPCVQHCCASKVDQSDARAEPLNAVRLLA